MTETTTVAPALGKRAAFALEPVLLVTSTNPKKKGSMSYDRFQNYFAIDFSKPVTVADCIKAGVRQDDIRHDSDHGYIVVGAANIEAAKTRVAEQRAAAIEAAKALLAEVELEGEETPDEGGAEKAD